MSQISNSKIDYYSKRILEDYDSKNPSILFKDKIKLSNNDALLIQSNVENLRVSRGDEIFGYKIGCISKQTQQKMGFTQPAYGTLWKNEIYQSGIKLNKNDYTNPSMEAEFGVILNRDINPALVNSKYLMDSVESIYPLIEIHNLVFYGAEPHGAELLANNAIHAGVILGEEIKCPLKKKSTDLKLIYDGNIIDTWVNKEWPNDIMSEVEWLVKIQAKRNNFLKKGNLILTGAYGFPVPINDKELVEVTSSAYGDVKAEFI